MKTASQKYARLLLNAGTLATLLFSYVPSASAQTENYEFNDSHFHLTNNIQEGPSIRDLLNMMGNKVGRSTVFGVPLQQEWLYGVDGDRAPTYYLHPMPRSTTTRSRTRGSRWLTNRCRRRNKRGSIP